MINILRFGKLVAISILVGLLAACAHPISVGPNAALPREEARLVAKKVAYAMSDGDRAKQVTSPGGGGDSISYYPYRDLEKAIREALRSVYQEVSTVQSPTDARAAPGSEIDLIFVPTIKTTSHSPSALTWPPTEFNTEITCSVQDASGQEIATIKAIGQGRAEFEEFRSNFSLAANRAANDVSAKLSEAIRQQDKLR